MRIIKKNKNKHDCGIVAAFNAAAWSDLKFTYKKVEKIAKSCGYNPNKGIYQFQFSNLLKKLSVPAKQIKPKSMESLTNKVYLGKCLVILYTQNGIDCSHIITVFRDHTGTIKMINPAGEIKSWGTLATDIRKNGMREFYVYEIPNRKLVRKYDDNRTA